VKHQNPIRTRTNRPSLGINHIEYIENTLAPNTSEDPDQRKNHPKGATLSSLRLKSRKRKVEDAKESGRSDDNTCEKSVLGLSKAKDGGEMAGSGKFWGKMGWWYR